MIVIFDHKKRAARRSLDHPKKLTPAIPELIHRQAILFYQLF